MRIGIIGGGNVGAALGKAFSGNGHEVVFGLRDPGGEKAASLIGSIGGSARAASVAEAAAAAEVVVLAVPWDSAYEAVQATGGLDGNIVIDATNPLAPELSGLKLGTTTSAAEQIAEWAPRAKVVKAFNTIGANHMADPRFGDARADMFICGDDDAARVAVAGLAKEIGFDVVDAGPLRQARLLEPLAMLWISLAYAQGQGRNIAFKLLRK